MTGIPNRKTLKNGRKKNKRTSLIDPYEATQLLMLERKKKDKKKKGRARPVVKEWVHGASANRWGSWGSNDDTDLTDEATGRSSLPEKD